MKKRQRMAHFFERVTPLNSVFCFEKLEHWTLTVGERSQYGWSLLLSRQNWRSVIQEWSLPLQSNWVFSALNLPISKKNCDCTSWTLSAFHIHNNFSFWLIQVFISFYQRVPMFAPSMQPLTLGSVLTKIFLVWKAARQTTRAKLHMYRRLLLKLEKQIGVTIYRPILAANKALGLEGVHMYICLVGCRLPPLDGHVSVCLVLAMEVYDTWKLYLKIAHQNRLW